MKRINTTLLAALAITLIGSSAYARGNGGGGAADGGEPGGIMMIKAPVAIAKLPPPPRRHGRVHLIREQQRFLCNGRVSGGDQAQCAEVIGTGIVATR
jgi:hypothetical protein